MDVNLRYAVMNVTINKNINHRTAFCLFCYTDKEAKGQALGTKVTDQDMQKRPRAGQSGSQESHPCWRRAAAKKDCGLRSVFVFHLLPCLGAWNSTDA